jgi:hypothetical protein
MTIKSLIDSLAIGTAWNRFNLTVHPLIGSENGKASYLILDQAMATGQFRIVEVSVAGSVPELKVINGLSQPVLLLDGEELIGVKQNRVLNLTIMIPAKTEMTIPVSCVEAGRWRHDSDSFAAAGRAQFARGRAKKLTQVSAALCETGGRHGDQTDIWNEIATKSVRMGVSSPTGAMAALYEQNQAQLNDFVHAMPRCERQVGAVVSINGQIVGVDVFDCADIFTGQAAKLIRSYAVDAMDRPSTAVGNGPTADAVRAFLDEVGGANTTRSKALGLGDDLRLDGLALAGAALEISGQIVHVVAFPAAVYDDYDADAAQSTRMTRARHRRSFH